jgi:hypothetical protein
MGKRWLGSTPCRCQMCDSMITTEFFDCYVPRARCWGVICPACFELFRCRLGKGKGQRYVLVGTEWHQQAEQEVTHG